MWRLILLLALMPAAAASGAWPRDEGAIFLSFGASPDKDGPLSPLAAPAAYLEYGLTPRTTVGAEIHTADADATIAGSVFVRRAMDWQGGVWALSLSAGARQRCGCRMDYSVIAGLHWGLGLAWGWIGADAMATVYDSHGSTEAKADFTVGRHLSPRIDAILALQTGIDEAGDPYARLNPQFSLDIGKGQRLVAGYVLPLGDGQSPHLTLGSWLQF